MTEEFDIVIYELSTRRVETIAAEDLRYTGFYNVDRMQSSIESRINGDYGTAVVPAGRLAKGDILPEDL